MANQFLLKILSPNGSIFSGNVNSFQTVTEKGAIGIYANMVETIGLVKPCISRVDNNGKWIDYIVLGGLLVTKKETTTLFCDFCVEKDSVNKAELQKEVEQLNTKINSANISAKQKNFYITKNDINKKILDLLE